MSKIPANFFKSSDLMDLNFRFVNYFFEDSVRGYEVVLLFSVAVAEKTKDGEFFALDKMPPDFFGCPFHPRS